MGNGGARGALRSDGDGWPSGSLREYTPAPALDQGPCQGKPRQSYPGLSKRVMQPSCDRTPRVRAPHRHESRHLDAGANHAMQDTLADATEHSIGRSFPRLFSPKWRGQPLKAMCCRQTPACDNSLSNHNQSVRRSRLDSLASDHQATSRVIVPFRIVRAHLALDGLRNQPIRSRVLQPR